MNRRPTVLATDGGPEAREPLTSWGRLLAGGSDARLISVPRDAPRRTVLDLANKLEVQWVVAALRCRDTPEGSGCVDEGDLGPLLRGAPCPVLAVPPWTRAPASSHGVAVVGVDRSSEAREAAHASARMLTAWDSPGRLVLAHGCETHPAELASETPWSELVDRMRLERHDWLVALASELRSPKLLVEIVVQLAWAADLIGGMAQREDADFVGLGVVRRPEGEEARLGRIHQNVVRSVPCPLLTTTATVTSAKP